MNTSKYKMNISLTVAKMRNLFLLLLSLVTLIAPLSNAFAQQQYPVKIQPSVTFPSTFLSDYSDPANTNIRVFLSDITKQDYEINVRVTLTNITTKAISYESIHGINVIIDGGVAYFLNYNELANLFALGDLKISGSAGTEANVLPEGQYSMSMQAYDANLFPLVPVSNARTDFALFNVVRYDPPLLNTPTDKKEFDLQTTNQNIFFNWTPRHIAYSSQQIQYRYRLIRVLPVDRNPYDAVNASIAGATGNIDVDALDFATFIYSPTDLELVPGGVYAWQVQAYEMVNGKISTARFKNQGLSEVFTLSIKEQCNQISLITPLITGSAITFSWSSPAAPHSVYSEYEFNYRKANSSLPWTPIITTQTSITLDNTVLQTGVAYEYNVRARCNNWLEPVQGSSVTLAAPTCVAPAPLTVTTTASNSILSWTAVSGPDSLQLSYKVVGSTEPFTTKTLSTTDVQYALNLLSSGGYVVRLDAFCGAQTALGKQDTIAYNESGIVGPCPIPMPFELIATRERGKIDTANIKWNSMSVHTASSITYWHKDSSAVKYSYTQLIPGAGVNGRHVYNDQMYAYQIDYLCGTKHKLTPVGMFRILSTSGQLNLDPPTANCFPPVDIRAEARDTVTARVEWDKISGADSYELSYRVKGTTTPFETFNTTATNAILKPLQQNAKYQLLVRVKCSGVFSIYSDTAVVDLSLGRTRNCDTVTFFKALNKTTTNIQTAWNFDSTCTGYIIKFREETQPLASEYTQAFTNIDTLKHKNVVRDTVRFTFQNLKSGTRYVFRIQKICGQNNALFNLPLIATTLADAKSSGACGSANACDKNPAHPLTSLKVTDTIYCADYEVVIDSITMATSNPSIGKYSGLGHMAMPVPGLGDFVNMHVSFHDVKINAKPNSCLYDGIINIDSMNASIIPTGTREEIQALVAKADAVIAQANAALNQIQAGIDGLQAGLQQGMNYFQGGDGVGNVKTGQLGDQTINTNISVPPPTAGVNGTEVTVNGVTKDVGSLPALLKDTDGEVFQVTSTGQLTYVGKYDTAFAKTPTLDLTDQIVTYTEFSGATFDFDAYQSIFSTSIQLKSEYEKITNDYYVPAKFIIPGALDKVTATINTSNSDADKVVFSNSTGFVYAANPNGKKFTLNLAGGPASDGQYIYAWYVDGTNPKKAIGKLLMPSYAPQVKNVVIIPVKEPTGTVYDAGIFEAYLNETYNKIGITYHVTIDNRFNSNTDWAPDGNTTVQPLGSSLLNDDYRGKEAAMIEAYVAFITAKGETIDPKTAYFLSVYEASLMKDEDPNIKLLGKMPPEEQFGFLYSGGVGGRGTSAAAVAAATVSIADGLKRTVAHELGHGAYHLEHTFIGLYLGKNSKGSTANLMDYSTGKDLWKLQWDVVHDPGHVWSVLRRDRDAQNIVIRQNLPEAMWNTNKTSCSFITPGGSQITLPNTVYGTSYMFGLPSFNSDNTKLVTGTLMRFYLPIDDVKGQRYNAYIDNQNVFQGYFKSDDNGNVDLSKKFDIALLANGYENKFIVLYPLTDGWYLEKIEVQNALVSYKDASPNTAIVTERTSPVIINKNTTKILSQHYGFSTNNTGIEQTSFNLEYRSMILSHESGPELLAVLKIVQLRSIYPGMFDRFCTVFDQWNNSPTIGVFAEWDKKVESTPVLYSLWQTNKEEFYLQMIDAFNVFATAINDQKFDRFHNSITNVPFDQIELLASLELFSDNEVSEISIEDRVRAIGVLASEAPRTNSSIEQAIVRLIKCTPAGSQSDQLLVAMQMYNPIIEDAKFENPSLPIVSKILIYQLISGFQTDWMPFTDNNYKDLLKAFIKVCNNSQTFYTRAMAKDADVANFESNSVVYRYSSIWAVARNAVFGGASLELGFDNISFKTNVTLTNNTATSTVDLNVKQENCVNAFANCTEDDLGTFNIFEPVWISQNGSLSILSDAIGLEGAWIPAFALKYAYDKGNEQTTSDITNAAIDAAGLFTGLAELRAGVKGLKMAMALSDVLASSVGLVDNATNGQITQNYPNFAACVTTMDVLSGAIGLKQALANGLSASNNRLQNTYAITKNLTNNNSTNLVQYTNNYLASVETAAAETMKWSNLPTDVRIKHIKFTEYLAVQANLAGNASIVSRAKAVLVKMRNSFSALYIKYALIDLKLTITGDLLNVNQVKVATIDNSVLKLESNVNVSTTVTATNLNSVSVDGVTSIEVNGTTFGVTNPKLVKTPTGYTCLGDGAYCFVAGTPILTASGDYVAIEKITSKNIVSAYDHNLKANVANRVTNTFSKTVNQLVKLVIGGALIWTTTEHPLYANDKYTPAKELHVGDSIRSYDGKNKVVESINFVDTSATVYNFEVADYHNYFVGKNALLVHNSCSFVTVKERVTSASDWTIFQSNLISSNIPAPARLTMYGQLTTLSQTDLNAWVKNFNDPKVITEINRIYGDPDVLSIYPTLLSDLSSDAFKMKAFQEVTNDPILAYEKLSQGLYSGVIETWLRGKMWSYVRSGKDFEDAIGGMIDTRNALIMGKLETALGLSSGGLNDFISVDQLQINIGTTYFVADRALIKNLGGGKFDVYILEMKISSGTSLTSNQTSFINSYNTFNSSNTINAAFTMTTRSTSKSAINANSTINILGAKRVNGPINNYSITNYQ